MGEAFVGIDAGTSGVKVCAFDRDGTLLAKAHRPIPVVTPHALWAEMDVERYWQATAQAISEVAGRVPGIVSAGLASTCPTTILLDGDGRPVRPGILYLDGRGEASLSQVVGDGGEDYRAKTGNQVSASTCWVANLDWIRRNEPEAWRRTVQVTMLNGYIGQCLTGAIAMEPTHASYSGLMDLAAPTADWDDDLLDLWGLDRSLLPDIRPCTHRLGTVTSQASLHTGLAPGTVVALGAADTAAAAFAVGLVEGGGVFESVGTSGVITFSLDGPDFEAAFLNRQHVVPGRWLAHGAMSTLGGTFGWLKSKIWPETNAFAELEQFAQESVPGANGLIFLPYLAGERTPLWDAHASGAWLGLQLRHGRADMVRAVFEGTAYALRQIYERGADHWGVRPGQMIAVGGGARNSFWSKMKASVLNLPYATSATPDAAGLGAALIGAVAVGAFSGPRDGELPFLAVQGAPIHPADADARRVYDEIYAVFADAYPQTRNVMHQLAAVGGHSPTRSGRKRQSARTLAKEG